MRLASAGHRVAIGSRDASRAAEVASTLVIRGAGVVEGVGNEAAAACEVVVIATPWESAVELATSLRDALAGKVVISMVNALVKRGREMVPLLPGRGSMAAELAAALPASRVVGAYHHLPAADMEDLDSGLEADVLVVGDDAEARAVAIALTNDIEGLRAVEAGSLALAGAVESFTAVCISVNIRHRAHSTVRLAGLA